MGAPLPTRHRKEPASIEITTRDMTKLLLEERLKPEDQAGIDIGATIRVKRVKVCKFIAIKGPFWSMDAPGLEVEVTSHIISTNRSFQFLEDQAYEIKTSHGQVSLSRTLKKIVVKRGPPSSLGCLPERQVNLALSGLRVWKARGSGMTGR